MSSQPQLLSETLSDQLVEQALDGQRRRIRGLDLLGILFAGAAALLIVPLLAVISDHNVPGGLPQAVIAGAGVVWGILIVVALIALRLYLHRRRPQRLFLARDLEETYGIPNNLLVNTVQIAQDQDAVYAESIAKRQTAAALQTATLQRPSGPLVRRQALPFLLVLAVWVLYATLGPKSIWPSLARFLGFGLAAPTATSLEWRRPGEGEDLYLDRPLEIVVATHGRQVPNVQLSRFDDPAGPAVFTCQLQPVSGQASPQLWRVKLAPHELTPAFHYAIVAGDAKLTGSLAIQEPVQVSMWEIELTPPAYTGAAPRTVRNNEVLAWAGTKAVFHVRANAPIEKPIFVLGTDQGELRTRMMRDHADPSHASHRVQLTDSGTFRAVFQDVFGRAALPVPPGRLTVREDQPPMIAVVEPSREDVTTRVDVTLVPRVRISVRDDIQLTDVRYVVERDGRPERGQLADQPGRGLDLDWALTEIELGFGDEVRLWFEATDNRVLPDGTAAPQTSRTRALVLTRSVPLAPVEDGVGAGGDGGEQEGEGQGDGPGEGTAQQPGENGAGGAGGTPGQGNGDAPAQGGAGQGAGVGDAPSPDDGAGQAGEGQAKGGTPGPGAVREGDGTVEGDGQPDVEGPGGQQAAGGEDFDQQMEDFVEQFGEQAQAVLDEMLEADAPEQPEDPAEAEADAAVDPEGTPADTVPPPAPEEEAETPAPGNEDKETVSEEAQPEDAPEPSDASEEPEAEPGDAPTEQPPSDAASTPGTEAEGEPQESSGDEVSEDPQPEQQTPEEAIRELLAQAEPPELEELSAAGLSAAEAQMFLAAFERLRENQATAPVIGDTTNWESGALGDAPERAPGELSGDARLEVAPGEAVTDRLRRFVAPPDQLAPAEWEAVLDAYYRAMAELDPERVAPD